jgi:hypothetical protein
MQEEDSNRMRAETGGGQKQEKVSNRMRAAPRKGSNREGQQLLN